VILKTSLEEQIKTRVSKHGKEFKRKTTHLIYHVQCDVCGTIRKLRNHKLKKAKPDHIMICSNDCKKQAHKSGGLIERRRAQTNLKKFGTENVFASETIKTKISETWKSTQGGPYCEKARKKAKQTLIDNFGHDGIGAKEIQEKTVKTMIERYGVERPMQMQHVKESLISGSVAKFGEKYFLQSRLGRQTYKNTMVKIYGVNTPLEKGVIRDKIEQTILNRYGAKNISQTQYFANLNIPAGHHESGYHRFRDQQIWYRSSYERRFLEHLTTIQENIQYIECNIPIDYDFKGTSHKYFIDFGVIYKNGRKVLYEIKAKWDTLTEKNVAKFESAKRNLNQLDYDEFKVITENELDSNNY